MNPAANLIDLVEQSTRLIGPLLSDIANQVPGAQQGMPTLLYAIDFEKTKTAREQDWKLLRPIIRRLSSEHKDAIKQTFDLGDICELNLSLHLPDDLLNKYYMFEVNFGQAADDDSWRLSARSEYGGGFDKAEFARIFSLSSTPLFFSGTLIWLYQNRADVWINHELYKHDDKKLNEPPFEKSFWPYMKNYLLPKTASLSATTNVFMAHLPHQIFFRIVELIDKSHVSQKPVANLFRDLSEIESDLKNTYVAIAKLVQERHLNSLK